MAIGTSSGVAVDSTTSSLLPMRPVVRRRHIQYPLPYCPLRMHC
jgi:hypothetical protein